MFRVQEALLCSDQLMHWWMSGRVFCLLFSADRSRADAGVALLERRARGKTCIRYLAGNLDRLAYEEFLAHGFPVATGVVEGACRYLVKDRMERLVSTGTLWRDTRWGASLLAQYGTTGRCLGLLWTGEEVY